MLLGSHRGRDVLLCLLSRRVAMQQEDVRHFLLGAVVEMEYRIAVVPSNSIRRTTSGKPIRKAMWIDYLEGEFDQYLMHDAEQKSNHYLSIKPKRELANERR